ncbi:MAG: 3-hydroxyacyl-CoA dehydrogenase family protein, partial [Saprospiraceae bacterium]
GRPRTGVFRLSDLVGHDTSAKVIETIRTRCTEDEQVGAFEIPKYIDFLLENKFLGDKTGQGFYKKTKEKDANGRKIVLALDLDKLEYRPKERVKLASLDGVKTIESLSGRIKYFFKQDDKAAQLVQKSLAGLFAYVSNRIPEISDNLYSIDDALRSGFAWDVGPFEYWDMIGAEAGIAAAEANGETVAQWVHDMVAAGHENFYKVEGGVTMYYDIDAKAYKAVPGMEEFVILDNIRSNKPVYENPEAVAHDIGDGVLCLEFRSKMNSIGEGVLRGINDTIQLAEDEGWNGVVIGNNAEHFSVGANLMMIGMMAGQGEFEELNFAVNAFQQTTMRCR